ncbi:MAG: hypothetical protein FWD77_07020 [Betaproteobacteria bacterium]|nr:hypothetical protein [Betaproteobacteria bacterium]
MLILGYSPHLFGSSDNPETPKTARELSLVFDWLANAPDKNTDKDLENLRIHTATLFRAEEAPQLQRLKALDLLYQRRRAIVARLVPTLNVDTLPVPRKVRNTARKLQGALQQLAAMYLDMLKEPEAPPEKDLRCSPEVALYRAVGALEDHLFISYLISARPGLGIWKQLHTAYALACKKFVHTGKPVGEEFSIRERYIRALLFSCSQPSSFASRELRLVKVFVDCFSVQAWLSDTFPESENAITGGFWIDPDADGPPFALARRPLPLGVSHLLYFSGDGAAAAVSRFLDGPGFNAEGAPAQDEAAITAAVLAGRGTLLGEAVLRRLMEYWGAPDRHHFHRRYQNYRTSLCTGLEGVRRLINSGEASSDELSEWMVLNESPQGYTMMLVSGKPNRLRIGDVLALCAEGQSKWQVCAVRWAISENPEHLEIGVQVLALEAQAGLLAFSRKNQEPLSVPALILSQCLPLRPSETLLIAAGSMETAEGKITLMLGKERLQLRDLHIAQLLERTAHIELLEIEEKHYGEETLVDLSGDED